MTPRCYNREPFAAGRTVHNLDRNTGEIVETYMSNDWFTDRCTLWDDRGFGPDTNQSFAEWQGYDCGGCRWRNA